MVNIAYILETANPSEREWYWDSGGLVEHMWYFWPRSVQGNLGAIHCTCILKWLVLERTQTEVFLGLKGYL